jgi:hypothetical protein
MLKKKKSFPRPEDGASEFLLLFLTLVISLVDRTDVDPPSSNKTRAHGSAVGKKFWYLRTCVIRLMALARSRPLSRVPPTRTDRHLSRDWLIRV